MIHLLASQLTSKLKGVAVDYGKKKLNSLIANVEQLIFDDMNKTEALSEHFANEARVLLRKVHVGATPEDLQSFNAYLDRLEGFVEGDDAYTNKLFEIMQAAKSSGNPEELLQSMVEQEAIRRTNEDFIGEEGDVVLPDNFFAEEMKVAELSQIESSHLLKVHEYNEIKAYFEGEICFNLIVFMHLQ